MQPWAILSGKILHDFEGWVLITAPFNSPIYCNKSNTKYHDFVVFYSFQVVLWDDQKKKTSCTKNCYFIKVMKGLIVFSFHNRGEKKLEMFTVRCTNNLSNFILVICRILRSNQNCNSKIFHLSLKSPLYKTSQLIYITNQLTGFYMIGILVLNAKAAVCRYSLKHLFLNVLQYAQKSAGVVVYF